MGLLVGFLGGAGKGAANYAQTVQAEKATQARDAQKHQWDMEAEDRSNQFQTERDTTQHQYALEATQADVEAKRDMLRFTVKLTRDYEQEDITAAKKAVESAGGDFVKAVELAPTANAKKVIMDMGKFADERANAKTSRAKDEASIRSSDATAAHQRALAKDPHGGTETKESASWITAAQRIQDSIDKNIAETPGYAGSAQHKRDQARADATFEKGGINPASQPGGAADNDPLGLGLSGKQKAAPAAAPAPAPKAGGLLTNPPPAPEKKTDSIDAQNQRNSTGTALAQVRNLKEKKAVEIADAMKAKDTKRADALIKEMDTLNKQEKALKQQYEKQSR